MSDAQELVEHLKNCRGADAAIVVDGNGDDVVAALIAAGWRYEGVEYALGKRIRHLVPPSGGTSRRSPHQGKGDEMSRSRPAERGERSEPE